MNASSCCTLPICSEWRIILTHYSNCTQGYDCTFQSCGSSRALIEHYDTCKKSDCRFCAPLRKCSTTKKTTIVCEEITSGPSTSEFAASISKGFCSGQEGWTETACSARQAYFSTYRKDFYGEHHSSSYRFMTSSMYSRSPYGKTERIQRELIVMFHVQKCAELDHHSKMVSCTVPHCPKMKRTLIHVAMCPGESCVFPECDTTRKIIQHWLKCTANPERRCDVCYPVLKTIPALDGDAPCEMDDKLLALLYTSTNGLIDIVSSDLSIYEDGWSDICYDGVNSSKNLTAKRKFSNSSVGSLEEELDKRRRVN